jgi:hypothetical protein
VEYLIKSSPYISDNLSEQEWRMEANLLRRPAVVGRIWPNLTISPTRRAVLAEGGRYPECGFGSLDRRFLRSRLKFGGFCRGCLAG